MIRQLSAPPEMLIRPLRQIPLLILCSACYQRKKFRCYALAESNYKLLINKRIPLFEETLYRGIAMFSPVFRGNIGEGEG